MDINDWLTTEFGFNKEKTTDRSTIMFIAMKCECTDSIHTLLRYIYNSVTDCSNDQEKNTGIKQELNQETHQIAQECFDKNRVISFFEKCNHSIALALTTLFLLSDLAPITKLSEPHFF